MSSFAFLCILCIVTVRSFPLQEIGKNALVLKRIARHNNYTGQSNLVSTEFYKSSNISALLNAFYENYYKNKDKGKKGLENGENPESHIENEVNFSSEVGNNDENNLKATKHAYMENTGKSEEDERENESTEIKKDSEEINEYKNNSLDDNHELYNDVSRSDESDEDYKNADEVDYENAVFGNDFDDNETNGDRIDEDFTDEDYNSNEKGESAESDINIDNDDKYHKPMINKVENYNAIELDNNLQDNKIDNSRVINSKLEVSHLPEDNDQNYFFTNSLSGFKNIKPNGYRWFDGSSDYSRKPSGKKIRLDSKYSNNRITLRDKGKRNSENDHSVSGSAFGEQSDGLWSGNGNLNYHQKSSHFGSNVQNDK